MNPNTQADFGKLLLRLTLGVVVLFHGIAKLRGGIGGIESMVVAHGLPSWLAYGVFAGEVLAPILVLVGFYARLGGALIAVNMLFAIFLAHMGQLAQLSGTGGWALELQGMFLFSAIAVALLGAGRYSADRK